MQFWNAIEDATFLKCCQNPISALKDGWKDEEVAQSIVQQKFQILPGHSSDCLSDTFFIKSCNQTQLSYCSSIPISSHQLPSLPSLPLPHACKRIPFIRLFHIPALWHSQVWLHSLSGMWSPRQSLVCFFIWRAACRLSKRGSRPPIKRMRTDTHWHTHTSARAQDFSPAMEVHKQAAKHLPKYLKNKKNEANLALLKFWWRKHRVPPVYPWTRTSMAQNQIIPEFV